MLPERDFTKPITRFILKEKIGDMIKYGRPAVGNFPRRERRLADEIQQSMYTMYRLAIVIEKKYYKKTTLQELDVELDVLRHFVRMAADKSYFGQNNSPPLAFKKYEHWSKLLDEIGRIIGGYMNAVK